MVIPLFKWDIEKNILLKKTRNISFEDIVNAIETGNLLDIVNNPSGNFKNQDSLVVSINDYAYLVPFVENKEHIFLKTVYPSRKYTKLYLKK